MDLIRNTRLSMTDLNSFVQMQLDERETPFYKNRIKRKDKWLKELNKVYGFIEECLLSAQFPQKNITYNQNYLSEDFTGSYQAPGLIIKLPKGGDIKFIPIGSSIIGGLGRIDAFGPSNERVKIIASDLEKSNSEMRITYGLDWTWQVFPNTRSNSSFSLNEEELGHLLTILSTEE